MAAPKGNKHAVGNRGGRPSVVLDKFEEVNAFIEFARDNPDCLTVPMFTTTRGYSSDTMLTWAQEDVEFRRLYLEAKELIGINRLKATSPKSKINLDRSIYMKGMGNYDRDHRDFEREEKVFESNLRKAEEGTKQTTFHITVPHGLAAGANIPTEGIPTEHNKGTK